MKPSQSSKKRKKNLPSEKNKKILRFFTPSNTHINSTALKKEKEMTSERIIFMFYVPQTLWGAKRMCIRLFPRKLQENPSAYSFSKKKNNKFDILHEKRAIENAKVTLNLENSFRGQLKVLPKQHVEILWKKMWKVYWKLDVWRVCRLSFFLV